MSSSLLYVLGYLAASGVATGWNNTASSPQYKLTQNYDEKSLLNGFKFITYDDPSNGFVKYVDQKTALATGLARTVQGRVFLGVDNETVLSTKATGRNSVRLESKKTWSSGLLIADIAHMPGNECGVWPAFWAYNMEENPIGEIDVIEGANHQAANDVSLHTGNACRFSAGNQTGIYPRTECGLNGPLGEDGCGMTASEPASYGTAFNKVGGGVYATQLEDQAIRIWHWPRDAVPADIKAGNPQPATWGLPMGDMKTANGGCDVAKNFHTMTIIINTDFCGDMVPAAVWHEDSVCAKRAATCNDFVAAHPEAFNDAYWMINSIRVYERQGSGRGKTA